MINLFFLINRQGKIRLTKFFETFNINERNKLLREVSQIMYIKHILFILTLHLLDSCCSYITFLKNE